MLVLIQNGNTKCFKHLSNEQFKENLYNGWVFTFHFEELYSLINGLPNPYLWHFYFIQANGIMTLGNSYGPFINQNQTLCYKENTTQIILFDIWRMSSLSAFNGDTEKDF